MKQVLIVLLLLCAANVSAQDVIVKKDGSTILSKVLEVNQDAVKYKKSSNLEGPIYTISLSEILSINYENGDIDDVNDFNSTTNGKEIVLNAGTAIPIQIVSPVKAADLSIGQSVDFKVNRDVIVDGITVIPYGTPVKGIVYKAKKSSWWGTKGKLGISIYNVTLPNGVSIPLNNGDIYVTGTNRTTLSVLLFLFVSIPACFICGSKAQIPMGYEIMASVASPIQFDAKGTAYKSTFPCKGMIEKNDGTIIYAVITSMYGEIISYKSDSSSTIHQILKKDVKSISLEKERN